MYQKRVIKPVMAYQGDLRKATVWRDRSENVAKIRQLTFWHCVDCGKYFETLKEAKGHLHE